MSTRARRTEPVLTASMTIMTFTALIALGPIASADSNLADGYPEPACGERPERPERPERFETEEAIVAYNAKVDAYNASMERLVECVNTYVTNAAADIERIRERARDAIDGLDGQ